MYLYAYFCDIQQVSEVHWKIHAKQFILKTNNKISLRPSIFWLRIPPKKGQIYARSTWTHKSNLTYVDDMRHFWGEFFDTTLRECRSLSFVYLGIAASRDIATLYVSWIRVQCVVCGNRWVNSIERYTIDLTKNMTMWLFWQ